MTSVCKPPEEYDTSYSLCTQQTKRLLVFFNVAKDEDQVKIMDSYEDQLTTLYRTAFGNICFSIYIFILQPISKFGRVYFCSFIRPSLYAGELSGYHRDKRNIFLSEFYVKIGINTEETPTNN